MDIASYHPQVVHFVVALLFVGVGLRVVSFTPWFRFSDPAARLLVLCGTLAAVLAVKSGTDAHGPVERVPGARTAVQEHEEWGERARNIFLAVAALELVAWGLARKDLPTASEKMSWGLAGRRPAAKVFAAAAGAIGLVGLFVVFEAAEHGGDLVYNYAGGVGIRSGDAADVQHLLTAGLYHSIGTARAEHRPEDAARYVDELARLRAADPSMATLRLESMIRDRNDAQGALAALNQLAPDTTNRRMMFTTTSLRAEAYQALGFSDSARIALQHLIDVFGPNPRLQARIDSLRQQ